MRRVFTILSFLLVSITASFGVHDDSLKTKEVIQKAVEKILVQDKQNRINEKRGQTFLNNYVIDIDVEHWIEEQGTTEGKILKEEDFKRMSQTLQAFNNRKDKLRLYVIVVNDYVVKFETRIDPSLLTGTFKWNDLQDYVDQQKIVKGIWTKTSALINDISAALESKGFPERMIYFYSELKVQEYDDTPRLYKFDRLNFIGKGIEPQQENIRKRIKAGANDAVSNIDQAINSIISGTKAVIDGEGDSSSTVDCSQSIETIIANTKSIRGKEYDQHVSAFAKLIDNPSSAQQKGSRYVIFDQPENLSSDDLFTQEILPDKVALLAQSGNSDYKLYVVFKEINFVMPLNDWGAFAQSVADKSTVAKQSNTILMVVPYFKTICAGTNWIGMTVGKGTGITMASVYTSASMKGAMNSALSAPGNSWKANFDQAFKQIPKAHTVYGYSLLWNGDFIQHEVKSQKNVTGYENFHDIIINDDGRYEELKKAEAFLTSANLGADVLEQQNDATDSYVNSAMSAYFSMVETTMGNEQLVKIKTADDVKQSVITPERALQYAQWVWTQKTDRAAHFSLPTVVPGNDWFYGGVNKVSAQGFMHVLDAASFVSSFVGLDIIFDTWQAYYAYDKGFYQDAAIAASAVAIGAVTAAELKTVLKGLKRGDLALVKLFYNKKLVVTALSQDRVYASFVPIVFKLNLENTLSNGLVSAIQNKETFLSTIAYARKAEYKSLVNAFEQAVDGSTDFKKLINTNPAAVDVFFKYSKQKPAATVDEILELATLTKELPRKQLDGFLSDFADAGFGASIKKNPELVSSWGRMYNTLGRTSQYSKDIPTLEKIASLSKEGSAFRTKLGNDWSKTLDDLLKNSTDLKCSSCTSGRIGRSSIDQFLGDAEHFISNFNVNSGGKGEVFYNWMRGTTNPTSGQLDELHQTLRDFSKREIKEVDVVDIGKQFPNGTKKYDLRRIGDKYTEYKNKDFVSSPLTKSSDDVDQFINGYLTNITSFDKLEWRAGLDKLKNSGWTDANALINMKKQWKKVFEDRASDIFQSNPSLFNKFKLKDGTIVTDSELFDEFLGEVDELSTIFDFIKVE